jgi:hypothetical protein
MPPMLQFERQRQKAVAEAEAKGQKIWTGTFDNAVRTKIFHALKDAAEGADAFAIACDAAQRRLVKALGKHRLTNLNVSEIAPALRLASDYMYYLDTCPNEMVPSVVEAAFVGLRAAGDTLYGAPAHLTTANFTTSVKAILDQHRILWDLVGDEMIELKSKELHSGVVEPALRLLAGRPDLAPAEKAYQDSLREVSQGAPEDAITDVGTALQEMLRASGCKGNSIGDLAADARKRDLLAPHDTRLAAGIHSIIEWVGADRSEKGDAHRAGRPSKDDAWLTIHVVGALIVRLAAGKR